MTKISLSVNGRSVTADVEPRMHLADFLRERLSLTGTHIGCEHGVCGACTILLDGVPARSCIAYAVGCEGAEITTLEGLEHDPVTARLRKAFSVNHALQCGYCTPGMLISCRDIVMRLPRADEARIRLELSGNLCRCTGYVGIVRAVQETLADGEALVGVAPLHRQRLGPVGAGRAPAQASESVIRVDRRAGATKQPFAVDMLASAQWEALESEGIELTQVFEVRHPLETVWKSFDDLDRMARCMPGARLTGAPRNGRAEGEMQVKLGPIVAAFGGLLEIERDEAAHSGRIRAIGRDSKSGSSARALIAYGVHEAGETVSRVEVSVKYLISGALGQFARTGLAKDVADHLTRLFARNLESMLTGGSAAIAESKAISVGALARAALWRRLRSIFAGKGADDRK